MAVSGHSSLKQVQPYIDEVDQERRLKSQCQNLRVDALTVSYPRLPLASSRRRIKTGMTAF